MELCMNQRYLIDEQSEAVGAIVLVVLYLCAWIFACIATYKALQNISLKEDIMIVFFLVTLHSTLIFRMLYLLGGIEPFCYKAYWYYYMTDMANMSKDLCLLCLLTRVWDHVGSFGNSGVSTEENIKYTVVFMVIHFFVCSILIIIEDSQAVDDILFHYLGGVQIILIFVYSYASYKLFWVLKQNSQAIISMDVKVMNFLSVLLIVTLFVRIIYNLGVEELDMKKEAEAFASLAFNGVSELLPCVFISVIIFVQQSSLLNNALSGSFFGNPAP